MTNITIEDINKIAKLSKIKITDNEKEDMVKQLGKIINWIDILSELDTEKVEILNNVHNQTLNLFEDEVKMAENIENVMKNSKEDKYNYFTVPKVIK